MKNSSLTLPALAVLVFGCNDTTTGGSATPPPTNGTVTHLVCKADSPNIGIDNATEIVFIDSLTLAGGDVGDASPTSGGNDGILSPETQASLVMLASNVVAGFGLLSHVLYQCTPGMYSQNGCNHSLFGNDVQTTVANNQTYVANVTTEATADTAATAVVTVTGRIGDSGNISIEVFNPEPYTLSFTRDGNGLETVGLESVDLQWTMAESSDCSGSFSYTSTEDEDEDYSATAQWTYSGGVTSGSGISNGTAFTW